MRKSLIFKSLFLSLLFLFLACDESRNENSKLPKSIGINYTESKATVEDAYNKLKDILQQKEKISIVAEVDHKKNAQTVALDLEAERVLFFGNPYLGTPLMQENQLVGLDLPQKILFYQDNKKVYTLYNNVNYLKNRYALTEAKTLPKIQKALENLLEQTGTKVLKNNTTTKVQKHEGIVTRKSQQDFSTTYTALKDALHQHKKINIMGELDHKANAKNAGMQLLPTKVIFFGNPALGTPLMQENPSIGLDLPQKMLVWENTKGDVYISYNQPKFLQKRHDFAKTPNNISKIEKALENFAKIAAGK